MMEFRQITFGDRDRIDRAFRLYGVPNCGSSFGDLMAWNDSFPATICETEGFLVMKCYDPLIGTLYTMPMGEGDPLAVLRRLEEEARQCGEPLRFYALREENIAYLHALYPDFQFFHLRERDEYVYLRSSLAALAGRKLKAKRYLSNQFRTRYNWQYAPLTPSDVAECLALTDRWHDAKMQSAKLSEHLMEDFDDERRSIVYAFEHFEKLALTGGKINVDGHLAAFCYGSYITDDMFCLYVEKADRTYEGIFTVINQEFARHLSERYVYINREYDCGIPSLREAKLHYHPTFMLCKWNAAQFPPENGIIRTDATLLPPQAE